MRSVNTHTGGSHYSTISPWDAQKRIRMKGCGWGRLRRLFPSLFTLDTHLLLETERSSRLPSPCLCFIAAEMHVSTHRFTACSRRGPQVQGQVSRLGTASPGLSQVA